MSNQSQPWKVNLTYFSASAQRFKNTCLYFFTHLMSSDSSSSSGNEINPSSPSKSNNGKKKKKRSKTKWTAAETAALITVLQEQKMLGNQAESGWKPVVWTAAATYLENNLPSKKPKSTKQVTSHFRRVCCPRPLCSVFLYVKYSSFLVEGRLQDCQDFAFSIRVWVG